MANADFSSDIPRTARKKTLNSSFAGVSPADSWGSSRPSAEPKQRKRSRRGAEQDTETQDPASSAWQRRSRTSIIPPEIQIPCLSTRPLPRSTEIAPLPNLEAAPIKEQTTGPIMIIPGNQRAHFATNHRLPVIPKSREHQRKKMHLLVVASMVSVVLAIMISISPINQAFAAPASHWLAFSDIITPPTPTATPSPTPIPPPVYAYHPVAGGSYGFICTALPFARLAYNKMLNSGMAHPWYVSMILAQWGVESGWSMPTYTGYNFGNVSALAGYPAIGGINVPGSPSAFAYAYTPLQGVTYYVVYSQMRLYAGVTAAYPQGPYAQAYAMGASPWDAAHYAINGQYGAKLVNVLNAFNLTRFDNPAANC